MFQFKTVGGDPEFLVRNSAGKIIPSWEIDLDGIKTLYPDNALCEMTLTPVEGVKGIIKMKEEIKYIDAFLEKEGYHRVKGQVSFDFKEYEDEKALWHVGCSPYQSIYKGRVKPTFGGAETVRTAGGHIHLGYDKTLIKTADLIKILDEVMYDNDPLRDPSRDILYGARGCYRPKPYGLEYRSPSNWWLDDLERLTSQLRAVEYLINSRR